MFKAYRAKSVTEEENSVVKGRARIKLNGGTSSKTHAIMDTVHWTAKDSTYIYLLFLRHWQIFTRPILPNGPSL